MAGAFQAHHLQPRTTVETQPKSNRNKNPEAHQIKKSNHTYRNQNTKPTKQPKSQNENTESEPTVKKNIYWFCYCILEEESSC